MSVHGVPEAGVSAKAPTAESHSPTLTELEHRLRPELNELEIERRRAIRKFWGSNLTILLSAPLVLGAAFGVAWLVHESYPNVAGLFLFCGLPTAFLVAAYLYRRGARWKSSYLHFYKEIIFRAVCRELFPGIAFYPSEGIPYDIFDGARLFPYTSEVYRSEDRIQGRVGKTDICLAEVEAERKRTKWDEDGIGTEYVHFFRGLFMIADFNKNFVSQLRVLPEAARMKRLSDEELIKMEDPKFESLFTVYGTDQVEARYILSTSLVRRIVELHKRWSSDVRLGFYRSHVYLSIAQGKDWFEPKLSRPAHDMRQAQEFCAQLQQVLGLVEELNLNTRIWSKR